MNTHLRSHGQQITIMLSKNHKQPNKLMKWSLLTSKNVTLNRINQIWKKKMKSWITIYRTLYWSCNRMSLLIEHLFIHFFSINNHYHLCHSGVCSIRDLKAFLCFHDPSRREGSMRRIPSNTTPLRDAL